MPNIDRLTWNAAVQTQPRRRWTAAETATLDQLIGKIPVHEIAEQLGRSEQSVYNKLNRLGYRITLDILPTIGLSVEDLAAHLNMPAAALHRHTLSGLLKTNRFGKYQVATWPEIKRYQAWYTDYQANRQRILDSIQEPTITKQEFMARAHLAETQATRYLKHSVVRCWKVPTIHHCYPNRDEWLVSLSDTNRLIKERAAGTLALPPAFTQQTAENSQKILAARHAGQLGHGNKIGPRHCPIPGYLSISQMAAKYHLSKDYLRQLVFYGKLKTRPYHVGKRTFHAVHHATARAFARRHKPRSKSGTPIS